MRLPKITVEREMIKKIDGRQVTKAVNAAYRKGREDEQLRFKRTIGILRNSTMDLWAELVRLDKVEPVSGSGICISRQTAESLIKKLRKWGKHSVARKFQKLLDASAEEQVIRIIKEFDLPNQSQP